MTRNLMIPNLLAAFVFFLLALTNPTSGADSRPIRVAHLGTLAHAPVLIARERQTFEKAVAPRPVEWKMFNAGPQLIEALFAREVDLAWVGPGPAVNGFARSNGEALRIISGLTQGGAGLVVRKGSGITDAAVLGGKRIATPQAGNTQDLALRHWLDTHALKPREKGGTVDILPMPAADQLTLFQRGEIDGAWAVEPWVTRLILEGPGELVLDEATIWPDGKYATTVLIARPELLRDEPALIATWLATQESLLTWMNANPEAARDEANAALAKLTGKGLPPAALASAWTRFTFTSDPARNSIETGARQAEALGFLGRRRVELAPIFALDPLAAGRRPQP
ncbi:MAG TPA: ABC transporter substrate-binding protein [Candidatus Eisenbacteria bacterium]